MMSPADQAAETARLRRELDRTRRAEGYRVSRGRVERLMRPHGIRTLARRRFRPTTTDSRHALPIAPNLLQQKFTVFEPNRV